EHADGDHGAHVGVYRQGRHVGAGAHLEGDADAREPDLRSAGDAAGADARADVADVIRACGVAAAIALFAGAASRGPTSDVRGPTPDVRGPTSDDRRPASGPERRFEFAEPHMGTLVRIALYARDEKDAARASTGAFERIARLDAALSDYRDDSELTQLSRRSSAGPVAVSDDLFRVLEAAQRFARASDG